MTIEQAAFQILEVCKVPINVKGFRFLHTGIVLCYKNPEMLDMVTKWLYPEIAKIHKTTPQRVERCMRFARSHSTSAHTTNAGFITAAVWVLKHLDEPPV